MEILYIRPRANSRYISDELKVPCLKCKQWKHISEFHTANKHPYVIVTDEDKHTRVYCRPRNHCKACVRQTAQEKRDTAKEDIIKKLKAIRQYKRLGVETTPQEEAFYYRYLHYLDVSD